MKKTFTKPNAETVEAMKQARSGKGLASFESVDDLMADLDSPEHDAFTIALGKVNSRYPTSLKKLSEAANDDNSDIS